MLIITIDSQKFYRAVLHDIEVSTAAKSLKTASKSSTRQTSVTHGSREGLIVS
jgi:hypothetical protein